MIIHKCDKCGKTTEQKSGQGCSIPNGWVPIQYGCGYSSYGSHAMYYEVCPECRTALKIPDGYGKAQDDVGDRLIEVISEIVQNEIES